MRAPVQWIPRMARGAYPNVVINLPFLETFSVSDASAFEVASLYSNLILPRGLRMSLHSIGEPDVEDVELFWSLFPQRGAVHNAQIFEEITMVGIFGLEYGDTMIVNGTGPSGTFHMALTLETPKRTVIMFWNSAFAPSLGGR